MNFYVNFPLIKFMYALILTQCGCWTTLGRSRRTLTSWRRNRCSTKAPSTNGEDEGKAVEENFESNRGTEHVEKNGRNSGRRSMRAFLSFRRWKHEKVTEDSHFPEETGIVIKLKRAIFFVCLIVIWGIPRLCHLYYPISSGNGIWTAVCFQQNRTHSNSIELIELLELNRRFGLVGFHGKFCDSSILSDY